MGKLSRWLAMRLRTCLVHETDMRKTNLIRGFITAAWAVACEICHPSKEAGSSCTAGPIEGMGRDEGSDSLSPSCKRRSRNPASRRASSDQGGVFTSPWSQTRGLSVGAFLDAIGTIGRPQRGPGWMFTCPRWRRLVLCAWSRARAVSAPANRATPTHRRLPSWRLAIDSTGCAGPAPLG